MTATVKKMERKKEEIGAAQNSKEAWANFEYLKKMTGLMCFIFCYIYEWDIFKNSKINLKFTSYSKIFYHRLLMSLIEAYECILLKICRYLIKFIIFTLKIIL